MRRYLHAGWSAAVVVAATAVVLTGCGAIARHGVAARTPADPAAPWRPPVSALPPPAPAATTPVPPDSLLAGRPAWTLADIVDLALRNNPLTRTSWARARAAAAALGSKQGAWWPQVDGSAAYQRSQSAVGSQGFAAITSFTPSATLTAVLFDFGKRAGDVEEARQALYQADWAHNQTIQDVVLAVESTYYGYLRAKALRDAARQAVAEADTNLAAAVQRRAAGLATVVDELQARSDLARRKLALQTYEGQIQTVRGSLATAMGLSPTVTYDVGLLPDALPADRVAGTVDELIAAAQAYRPELAGARAAVLGARAHVGAVKAEGRPEITLQANASRRWFDDFNQRRDAWLVGLFLNVPLFTGFGHAYDVRQAQAEADAAAGRLAASASAVALEVWNGYYDLRTATSSLDTAHEFLDYATRAHDAATERYRSGVGSLLDLLSAQTTLQDARAQDVEARTQWLLAVAKLAHATGRLGTAPPVATTRPGPETSQEGAR